MYTQIDLPVIVFLDVESMPVVIISLEYRCCSCTIGHCFYEQHAVTSFLLNCSFPQTQCDHAHTHTKFLVVRV